MVRGPPLTFDDLRSEQGAEVLGVTYRGITFTEEELGLDLRKLAAATPLRRVSPKAEPDNGWRPVEEYYIGELKKDQ